MPGGKVQRIRGLEYANHFLPQRVPLLHGDGVYMLDQVQGIVGVTIRNQGPSISTTSAGFRRFMASPWSNDGKIFLLDETGLTMVAERSAAEYHGLNRLNDDLFWSSMAVSGDRLILRGMQHLYIQK